MDSKPTSPEIPKPGENYEHVVGREFVRQYYTLLNQSPTYLHRFYATNSSFVHGALDPVYEGRYEPGNHEKDVATVYGQREIHQRIMQLNFQDCKTKIRQVDSHATIGNGVVVQVSGELSNSGQPMRRFMQTFVLEPQGPKKFYVRNDIFRYQDEVFSVADACISSGSAQFDSEVQLSNSMGTFASLTMVETVPADSSTYVSEAVCHEASMVNGSSKRESAEILPLIGEGWIKSNQETSEAEAEIINENMYEADCQIQQESIPADSSTSISESVSQDESTALGTKRKSSESLSLDNNLKMKTDHEPENDAKSDVSNEEVQKDDNTPQDVVVPNEPKTYANLLKSGTSSSNNQILNIKTGGGLPPAGFSKSDDVRSANYQGRGSASRNSNGVYQGKPRPGNTQVGGYSSSATRGGSGGQNGGNFNQTRYENGRDGGTVTSRGSFRGRGRPGASSNTTYQGQGKPKSAQGGDYSFSSPRGGARGNQNGGNFEQTSFENEDARNGATFNPRSARGRGRADTARNM